MIGCVLDAAKQTVAHINKKSHKTNMSASVAVLIPYGDPIGNSLLGNLIVEGPEDDVLKRYEIAQKKFFPNYICRITGDCPLVVPTLITKHISEAVFHDLDYVSNSIDSIRTHPDGYDCEVISSRAMKWLHETADNPFDREHVTTLLKRKPPEWVKIGAIISHNDLSNIKLSVDTPEELERVRLNKKAVTEKMDLALERGYAVFRF
jgi:spore coat polysaccharide biosynthesis protein SpsF